jgi:S-layer homology domain
MKKLLLTAVFPLLIAATNDPLPTQDPFATKPFTDVSTSHANYEAIEYLRANKVIKGYQPQGTFIPDRRITRGELLKLIINPLVLDTSRINECLAVYVDTGSTFVFFPDAPRDAFYANELCFARTQRIVNGYPSGKFEPNGYTNFVEMAKILSNVFALDVGIEAQGELWYVPYVKRLAEIHAIPTTVTRFDQVLTRGEMAEIVYRLKTHNEDKPSQAYMNLR